MITVARSRWGWTATHDSGRDVAHSRERSWLIAYLDACRMTWHDA